MAEALLKKSRVSPFTVLMGTISRQLGGEHLRRLKILLGGHINKENLSSLQGGFDLIHVLQKRGLVTEKKLSFIRKLLEDCELFSLVELLDEYKQTFQDMDGKTGDNTVMTTNRINALQRMRKRQDEELQNCAERGKVLKQTLEEKLTLLDTQKEIMIIGQEAIENISKLRESAEQERSEVEQRVQEQEAMFEAQEKELQEIQSLLRTKDKPNKGNEKVEKRRTVFESVLSKQSNEKVSKTTDALYKQEDEKRETVSKLMKSMNDSRRVLLKKRSSVRQCLEAVLRKTKELVSVDEVFLETMEVVRNLKKEIRQNELDLFDLQQQAEETEDEIARTRNYGIANSFKIPLWRLNMVQTSQSKGHVLNYTEVLPENSYSLGSLGMRSTPLQFDFPSCVASHKGHIYVADRKNCRILVINCLGELTREPIDFGNTGPVAIALNKRGNLIATDAMIIRVYSSDGTLSHNFLPVYSKRDSRPELSALTVDRDGVILAADLSNHRIQKFHIDGHFVGFIGGSMYLQYPSGVAVTENNDVLISESERHQLKVFHKNTESFSVLGRRGVGKDHLMNPRGLAIDNKGNILVADSLNHRIQVIDAQGRFITSLGRLGSGPGCLDTPYAVAVNSRGQVIIADSGNHRITCFT
ncbi:tripartite motif-containing protein 2-like isoform X1 [Montipora foliosa]|uniref:tripartite motif-containing protein 2-like isoform X1 n=2 Tax=Montipora foliosa TaxID=591990 RepID=UPI0035F17DF7